MPKELVLVSIAHSLFSTTSFISVWLTGLKLHLLHQPADQTPWRLEGNICMIKAKARKLFFLFILVAVFFCLF